MSHWKIKLSLCLNYIVFAILLNSVGPVILEAINHYGITKSIAGNLDAYKDLSIVVFSFIAASFLPRMGYKISMLLGLALISITCYLMPVVDNFLMIKLLLISVGVGFALIKVSAYATTGLITNNEKEHASFVSILEGIFMFGVLSGFWIFGFFISHPNTSWLDAYWLIGALGTLAFLLLAFTHIDESKATIIRSNFIDDFLSMIRLNKELLIMVFVISIFMYVFIEQGITTWLPTFNDKVLKITPSMSIEMASILSASIGLGRIVAGFILKRVSWSWVLIVCSISAGLMILTVLPSASHQNSHVITSWKDVSWVAFIFPLIGFFLAPIYPTLCSTLLSTLPKHLHSAMMGLIMIFSALGGALGSKVVGLAFGELGGIHAIGLSLIPLAILFILLFPYQMLRNEKLAAIE